MASKRGGLESVAIYITFLLNVRSVFQDPFDNFLLASHRGCPESSAVKTTLCLDVRTFA